MPLSTISSKYKTVQYDHSLTTMCSSTPLVILMVNIGARLAQQADTVCMTEGGSVEEWCTPAAVHLVYVRTADHDQYFRALEVATT